MKREDLIAEETATPFRAADFGRRHVICVSADASLSEAASLMREHHIGDLVVVEQKGDVERPVGMITDRDILIETLPMNVNPDKLYVSDIMSRGLATANENDDVFSLVRTMRDCGVVRLPLVSDQGALCGIVTARSLVQLFSEALSELSEISKQQHMNEAERDGHH